MIINERITDSKVVPISKLAVGDYFKMSETGSIRGKLYKVISVDHNSKGSQDSYIQYKDRNEKKFGFNYDTSDEPSGGRFVTLVTIVDDKM